MKWQHYTTIWDMTPQDIRRNCPDRQTLYQNFVEYHSDGARIDRAGVESIWYASSRPYYRVYPCVLEMARQLKEDSPVSYGWIRDLPLIKHPDMDVRAQTFAVDTPEGTIPPFLASITRSGEQRWRFEIYRNESDSESFVRETGWFDDRPHSMRDLLDSVQGREDSIEDIHRLVFLMYLLMDPSINLIDRIVLNRDQGKPVTKTVLDRAERLQGRGFTIGKDLESMPRHSRPHWGIRWCKPDHAGEVVPNWDGTSPSSRPGCVPKLRPISGANEEFYRRVPTSYAG